MSDTFGLAASSQGVGGSQDHGRSDLVRERRQTSALSQPTGLLPGRGRRLGKMPGIDRNPRSVPFRLKRIGHAPQRTVKSHQIAISSQTNDKGKFVIQPIVEQPSCIAAPVDDQDSAFFRPFENRLHRIEDDGVLAWASCVSESRVADGGENLQSQIRPGDK